MTTESKHPLSDLGDDFDPQMMPDYKLREAAGEFEGKSEDQIREVYFEEEADAVHDLEQQRLDDEEMSHDPS